MPRPRVTSTHRKYMRRTQRIFEGQERRAAKYGQQLDYSLFMLRVLVAQALWEPCKGCGTVLDPHNFSVDHAWAIAAGGSFGYANLQVLCGPCNRKKSKRQLRWGEVIPWIQVMKGKQSVS